ncbi:MAG TPA: glycoside hydrolase family 76 protein [Acidobacteriaceae bacterium]
MRVWFVALVVVCVAVGASAQTAKARASVAAADVQRFYDPATGLFCSGTGDCWWYSANELTALVDYSMRVKSKDAATVVANTFEKAGFRGPQKDALGPFVDTWTDDDGWWGLAWVDAYEYAKVYDPGHAERYLTLAKNIFAYMAAQWETGDCGGGLWQNQKPTHTKDAIANEVFFSLATGLYRRTGDKQYLDWAMREWKWFDGTGMVNADHLVYDHLSGSKSAHPCTAQGREFWTYNQGVVLGGLTDLYGIYKTRDPKLAKSLLARAVEIADCVVDKGCGGNTAISKFPLLDAKGILMEACGTNPCTYGPAYQFKGIFVRNLARLNEVAGKYTGFLAANAASAWTQDRDDEGLFGFYWDGPFYLPGGGKGAVQGVALDLMNTQVR